MKAQWYGAFADSFATSIFSQPFYFIPVKNMKCFLLETHRFYCDEREQRDFQMTSGLPLLTKNREMKYAGF